ncbi:DUF72 domain-containing protein [Cohnella nanjingensis]|uniref:DUF72 domain-containing protein n=1 Tax=Cohnella nanjingensis TaxID=1387779 RepID=A0A7X0RX97_9BACL|nr:DUF72 domain-containing protein [Cohnella nanjingensis]MBB6675363.1 DUF72 domain-containing protein [Cohnella nanjingensis]
MIEIGLAGWGDQDALYPPGLKAKDRLRTYARHFPVVEVDSSFYAIQPKERFARWVEDTPPSFSFVVKAYQEMTGHLRGKSYYADSGEMYAAFRDSIEPAREAGKLKAALFQYPPWFDCNRENVKLLRETRARMEGLPCALEFRHQSWFAPEWRDKTLGFMADEGWIHSVCDEPQAGTGSVPTVLAATHPALTIVRMHGRNAAGWHQSSAPNWREVRYLYRYSDAELAEWRDRLQTLQADSRDICLIFNNNSGGDAAPNAKRLMGMLGLPTPEGRDPEAPEPADAVPEQLDLFGGELPPID